MFAAKLGNYYKMILAKQNPVDLELSGSTESVLLSENNLAMSFGPFNEIELHRHYILYS